MKFQDSKFIEVVEILRSLEPKPRRNDKRRAVRTDVRLAVDIRPNATGAKNEWIKADVRNLSPRGMSLIHPYFISEGDTFLVRFPNRPGPESQTPMTCRVAHCDRRGDGTYIIGVEFTGRLNSAKSAVDTFSEQERIRRTILE